MNQEKKSKALNFRVAASFYDKVKALSVESGHEVSDICRFGMLACWPRIVALVMASPNGDLPEEAGDVAELQEALDMCRTAKSRGVDLRAALTQAIEAKLAQDAKPAAA